MDVKTFNRAARVLDKLEKVRTNADKLMFENNPYDEYSSHPDGPCPLSFVYAGAPVEVEDITVKWQIWNILVDHFGGLIVELDKEFADIKPPKKREPIKFSEIPIEQVEEHRAVMNAKITKHMEEDFGQ